MPNYSTEDNFGLRIAGEIVHSAMRDTPSVETDVHKMLFNLVTNGGEDKEDQSAELCWCRF